MGPAPIEGLAQVPTELTFYIFYENQITTEMGSE